MKIIKKEKSQNRLPMNTQSITIANLNAKLTYLGDNKFPPIQNQRKSVQSAAAGISVPCISSTSKLILPHHTLHRPYRAIHILRIFFLVVVIGDIALNFEVD